MSVNSSIRFTPRLFLSLAAGLTSLAWAADGSLSGKVDATPAKYAAESFVYVKQVAGTFPKKTETMDQAGMKFSPHLLAVTQGDTVKFLNNDAVTHNVLSPDDGSYNLGTFNKGETRSHTFDKEGVYSQLCSIHPEMLAYIFVGQNPFHAAVDAKGHYKIGHLPPGTYQVEIWNSHLKAAAQPVTVTSGSAAEANFSLKR